MYRNALVMTVQVANCCSCKSVAVVLCCTLAAVLMLVLGGGRPLLAGYVTGDALGGTRLWGGGDGAGGGGRERLQVILKPMAPTHRHNQSLMFRDLCTERDVPDVVSMDATGYAVPTQPVAPDNFTVVMVTHKRDAMLRRCLRAYGDMSRVAKIILYWNNPGRKPPDLTSEIHFRMPLVVKEVNFTTLRSRFRPIDEIQTQAVFITDDDLLIGEEGINTAFQVWKDHPWGIAGFTWRHYVTKANGDLKYMLDVRDRYSMILTNAAFVHREYLRLYTEALPKPVAKTVDQTFNCDDLAMNFLISHHCRCSAAYKVVPSQFTILSSSGISTKKNHMKSRDMCLTNFTAFYSDIPLQSKPKGCIWGSG